MHERGLVRVAVETHGSRSVVSRCSGSTPLAPRIVGSQRPSIASVALVQTAGGPIGGDDMLIEVDVGEGAALELAPIGATLVQPGRGTARQQLRCRMGPRSRLLWRGGNLIVSSGGRYESHVSLELADGAAALVRENVFRGRHGEAGGSYAGQISCELCEAPLFRDATLIDPDVCELDSAAVLDCARALGSVAILGLAGPSGVQGQCELAGPGALVRALAHDAVTLGRRLSQADRTYTLRLLGQREATTIDTTRETRGQGAPAGRNRQLSPTEGATAGA